MELLTIGAFARASRLSPKALRLYGERGLLGPAHVDPHSGYRLYAPDLIDHLSRRDSVMIDDDPLAVRTPLRRVLRRRFDASIQ